MARRTTAPRLAGALWIVLLVPACAASLVPAGDELRHARHGYSLQPPPEGWSPVDVSGAVVAYQRAGAGTMSLQSSCDGTREEPAVLARELQADLPQHTLRSEGPLDVDGRPGWTQTLETTLHAGSLRIKTVTVVFEGCSIDWLLVSSADFENAERDFDAWVAGVSLPPATDESEGAS